MTTENGKKGPQVNNRTIRNRFQKLRNGNESLEDKKGRGLPCTPDLKNNC